MKLIDGKEIAEKIYKELAAKLEDLEVKPKLAIILASNDEPSKIYVGLKKKKAEDLGIECEVFLSGRNISRIN
jgi:methylenetetrahydrofolate dehydrogenase (NADP+)/methenyltetrahydrofolate cyclohydrolase